MKKNKENEVPNIFYEENETYIDRDILNIPEWCRACDGPYPSCISSCPMFDE